MPTYVVLGSLTRQGIQTIRDVPKGRAAADSTEALGITLRERLLTMGRYDVVMTRDAPHDEALAKFVLQTWDAGQHLDGDRAGVHRSGERSAPRVALTQAASCLGRALGRGGSSMDNECRPSLRITIAALDFDGTPTRADCVAPFPVALPARERWCAPSPTRPRGSPDS